MRWLRSTAAVLTDAAALTWLVPAVPPLLTRVATGARPDDVVTALGGSLAVTAALLLLPGLALTWCAATGSLMGLATHRVERAAARVTPAAVRRVLAAGLGAGLGLGLMAPATASDVDLGWGVTSTSGDATAATPPGSTPAPSVPSPVPPPTTTTAKAPVDAAPGTVVVAQGDTLWDIAARHLAHPTAAEVAAAWPAWWEANRDVVADPDLIHPGQELRAPASAHVPTAPKEQP